MTVEASKQTKIKRNITFEKKLGQIFTTSVKKIKMLKPRDIVFAFAKIASFFFLRLLFICMWNHSFSTFAEFSKKLTFLTPSYANVRVRIRG